MKFLILILLLPAAARGQTLSDATVIIAKGVSFERVCNALLDSGYAIEKKDNDLMTVRTENRQYPNKWNATYLINIRIKDSSAYISGTFTAPPGGGLFKNEPIRNWTNRKGETKTSSLGGYPFVILDAFAHGLSGQIAYAKQ